MKLLSFFVLALLVVYATGAPTYTFSPSTYMGNGAFRTFLAVENEAPVSLGTEFSAAFFHEVPAIPPMPGMEHSMLNLEGIFLPDEAPVYTPFQSTEVTLSEGHGPPYDEHHFDFHYFFASAQQRYSNITAGKKPKICGEGGGSPDTYCRGTAPFVPACCPPAYGNIGVVVPGEGGHLVDLLSPEAQDPSSPMYGPWTVQVTLGAYNGRIVFFEVMIPLSHFEDILYGRVAQPSCRFIRLPQEFADPGYYPSMACASLTPAGNLRVELTQFVHYDKPGCLGTPDPTTLCTALPPRPGSPPPDPDFVKYCSCPWDSK